MQWAICWSGNSHLHLLRQKSNCLSHIVTQFIDVLFGVNHSRTLLESLLSVIVTHSSVLLMSSDTPAASSSMAFAMNATDHINVVFRKLACSLMSRVIASTNSIVTAIVNSDAYHQSPLMDPTRPQAASLITSAVTMINISISGSCDTATVYCSSIS